MAKNKWAATDAKWQIEQNRGWISNADQKASALLVFIIALITILFNSLTKNNPPWLLLCNFWLTTSFVAFFTYIIQTVYFSIKTINPDIQERKKSLFFFGSITKMQEADLLKEWTNLTNEKRLKNLINQVIVTSDIANNKNASVEKAIKNGICSLLPWLLIMLILHL